MHDNVKPILWNSSEYIILQVGTNDAVNLPPNEIIDKTLELNDASSATDSLKHQYSEVNLTNLTINKQSHFEHSSTYNISFIDGNEKSSERTCFFNTLNATYIGNINKLMRGNININSIRTILEMLSNRVKGNLDILMISERKLGSTFPSNQFAIEGYAAPIRFDRNKSGEGILLYTRNSFIHMWGCRS